MLLRSVKNSDSSEIIRIIDDTFREYGDRVCLDGSESDLKDIEAHYQLPDAAFVVLEDEGNLIGCHAVCRVDDNKFTFKRLYVRSDKRGSGAGDFLFEWALAKAVELTADDLRDPAIIHENQTSLDELTQLLGLGNIYSFQK